MKNHLQFHWWKYLCVILLSITLWGWIFDALRQPAASETVSILFIGEGLDTQALQQQLSDALPQLTDTPVKQITVNAQAQPHSDYYDQLIAQCYSYDLIILSGDALRKNTGQGAFVRLADPLCAKFPHGVFYREETSEGTLTYGLSLGDADKSNRFGQFYSGDVPCYLFISPESVDMNGSDQIAGSDAVIKTVQYLIEEMP